MSIEILSANPMIGLPRFATKNPAEGMTTPTVILDVVLLNTFYKDIINLRYSNMLFIFIIKVN